MNIYMSILTCIVVWIKFMEFQHVYVNISNCFLNMHSANNGESSNSCTLIIYSNTKHVLMFTDMFCCIVRNHTDFWMMMAEMQRKTKWMRRVMVEMRRMEIRSRKKKSRWLELQNFVFLYIFNFF